MNETRNDPHADDDPIPLSEMIETLRGELQKSQERGAGQAIAFQIDKVELQLKVAVSRKIKGEGGIAFWVIKAGASAEGAHDVTHEFKLTLTPVSESGDRVKVDQTAHKPASRT
jgi:hypothetical protein